MENKKNKQELVEYANYLAEQHAKLKLTIETILVEHSKALNKANEEVKIAIDSIVAEIEMMQLEYDKTIEEIKKG